MRGDSKRITSFDIQRTVHRDMFL